MTAVRTSSVGPKVSRLPCSTSRGTTGASSSAARERSGRPGRCRGKARQTTPTTPVAVAVRHATRAPELRPPASWQELVGHAEFFREHHPSGKPGPSLPPLPADEAWSPLKL